MRQYVNDNGDSLDILDDYEVVPEIIDYEKELEKDLEEGNGFIIYDRDGLDKNNNIRLENGIYSPKYGTIWGDDHMFEELYSCNCGYMQAKFNLGLTCPKCGSVVKFKDKNVHMTGWFKLEKYKIIHPNMYFKIASLIGTTRLKAILLADWDVMQDGNPIKPVIDDKTKNIKKYDNIGMLEFQKRFDEIIEFFAKKKKDKRDVYEFIMENREKVFTSCLPILPLFLRPIVIGEEDYGYAKINTKYSTLSTKFYNVNEKYEDYDPAMEKTLVMDLYGIQKRYNEVMDIIFESISRKNGQIRNELLAFRSNFAVRAVIVPLSGTKTNEVHFPYLGFLEMYRPEIVRTLSKLLDVTVNEAHNIWQQAQLKFDKKVYAVMQYIIEHTECSILLNRNPTLNFGSIVKVKIAHIKPDYSDLTISIPINIIPIMAADKNIVVGIKLS